MGEFTKRWWTCLVVLAQWTGEAYCAIHQYKDAPFRPYLDALVYGGAKEGMRSTKMNQNDTAEIMDRWVSHPASGMSKHSTDGFSYIRFSDLKFRRSKEIAEKYKKNTFKKKKTGLVQILIFEVSNLYDVGHVNTVTKEHTLCRSKDLSESMGCKEKSIILQRDAANQTWPLLYDVHFIEAHEVAHVGDKVIEIDEDGLYNMWFISCDPDFTGSKHDLLVSGQTIWKNPMGFLPGMMLPMIPMYGTLCLCYLVLGFVWIVTLFRNYKEVIMLQVYISIVLFLSMLETSLWYFDYVNFNNTGTRPASITVWAVFFGAVRKVTAKVVLLLVCMGYGVVKPTLGKDKNKIILLTGAFLTATILLDMLSNVGTIDDISAFGRFTLLLPVAALDGIVIVWVFSSLTKIIKQLQNRNQVVKLEMYKKLYNALLVAAMLSMCWMVYEMYFRVGGASGMQWKSAWISTCYWKAMTFGVTVVVCILWGPSKVSARYAFSEQLDGEDGLELAAKAQKSDEGVFSLEDEEEEGKLE